MTLFNPNPTPLEKLWLQLVFNQKKPLIKKLNSLSAQDKKEFLDSRHSGTGQTPLLFAVALRDPEFIECFIQHKKELKEDLKDTDHNGHNLLSTPFFYPPSSTRVSSERLRMIEFVFSFVETQDYEFMFTHKDTKGVNALELHVKDIMHHQFLEDHLKQTESVELLSGALEALDTYLNKNKATQQIIPEFRNKMGALRDHCAERFLVLKEQQSLAQHIEPLEESKENMNKNTLAQKTKI